MRRCSAIGSACLDQTAAEWLSCNTNQTIPKPDTFVHGGFGAPSFGVGIGPMRTIQYPASLKIQRRSDHIPPQRKNRALTSSPRINNTERGIGPQMRSAKLGPPIQRQTRNPRRATPNAIAQPATIIFMGRVICGFRFHKHSQKRRLPSPCYCRRRRLLRCETRRTSHIHSKRHLHAPHQVLRALSSDTNLRCLVRIPHPMRGTLR